jgi:surface carbohydrate biosynthesis protein
MQGGIYLGKGVFRTASQDPRNLVRRRALSRNGITIVFLHEEGAVFPGSDDRQWEARLASDFDPHNLSERDYVCTWGRFQEKFYRSFGAPCTHHIRTTGHPRFDLYKPTYRSYFEESVHKLRDEFGDFILVNSNAAAAQPALGFDDLFSSRNDYLVEDPSARTRGVSLWAHDTRRLSHVMELCTRLSVEFPDRRIVIRPHPAEDTRLYDAMFGEVNNVVVAPDRGPVNPWLLACTALIHTGCTTGIEAHMAGTRVINYRPNGATPHEAFLAGRFGVACGTEGEVVARLRAGFDTENASAPDGDPGPRARELLANLEADSFAKVVQVVHEAETMQAELARKTTSRARLVVGEGVQSLTGTVKGVVRPAFSGRQAKYMAYRRFFGGGFDRSEVVAKLAKAQNLVGEPVRATFMSDSLFVVESAG